MVSTEAMPANEEPTALPTIILSEGAGIALGSVFWRLVKKRTAKRPRSTTHIVLSANEDVRKTLNATREEKKRVKDAKLAKHKFENNGRVIPDAATNAALEKELVVTATKGAVALFNAVSKARKAAEDNAQKSGKKGPVVSSDNFMDMMRSGIRKSGSVSEKGVGEGEDLEESEDDEGTEQPTGSKAKWLKDDYLTRASKKLKDWDKPVDALASDSDSQDASGDSAPLSDSEEE